jgi:hypothetical protein
LDFRLVPGNFQAEVFRADSMIFEVSAAGAWLGRIDHGQAPVVLTSVYSLFSGAVYLSSVADFDDADCQLLILYGIQYAPFVLEDAVFVLSGQFLAPMSARGLGQACYSFHDAPQVCGRDALEVIPGGFLERDAISGHSP